MTQRFRDMKKCLVVSVAEGEGTSKDVIRIVYYVFKENGDFMFKYDIEEQEK